MVRGREKENEFVRVGQVTSAHGVRGWIKVRSDTEPPEAILNYQPWLLGPGRTAVNVSEASERGGALLVLLDGVSDRSGAESLAGTEIAVLRRQFPDLPPGRYYWADLVGCEVVSVNGEPFGQIAEMVETGANDVMRVRGDRERLIPFVTDRYVQSVDLEAGRIVVDWDPDF